MQVDREERLDDCEFVPTDHWDERPQWAQPELIVVHCISLPEGVYGTGAPRRLFCGELDVTEHETFADLEGLRVSPHVLIDRDGTVQQMVSFDKRAWHAGVSAWCGRPGCNDYSIGIELEGDVASPFADAQYQSLAAVVSALLGKYQALSRTAIVGHNEIAPGRKEDPGLHFEWRRLYEMLDFAP